jgi:hypothetical protein
MKSLYKVGKFRVGFGARVQLRPEQVYKAVVSEAEHIRERQVNASAIFRCIESEER